MGRRPAITDEEILAAARAVFLARGVTATTAEVAQRCGIGEATLFRRFPSKADLLREAMILGPPPWLEALPELSGKGDPRETLITLGTRILDFYRKALPLVPVALSNPSVSFLRRHEALRRSAIRTLTGFFAAEVRTGRIRLPDERFAARLFVGAILGFMLFAVAEEEVDEQPGRAAFLESLADTMCGPRKAARRRQ
jgi:AcrR family transcriptional regulator